MVQLLSELPEDIIHHIFYSCLDLSNQEVVQLSLVSKQFLSLLQKRPTLDFDYNKILPRCYEEPDAKYRERHRDELNYVVSTFDRYCRENIHLERFTLWPDDCWLVNKNDYPIYDSCIELAVQRSPRKLTISIHRNIEDEAYTLPRAIFQLKSLVELDFRDFCLDPKKIVVWPNLKKLLCYEANKEWFVYITRGCPSIENMDINCRRVSNCVFSIVNLRNLKKLNIELGDRRRSEMSASTLPSLESIECSCGHVDLGDNEYPNLTNLDLYNCCGMDDHFFNSFARKFPKLENLRLGCDRIQRIDLSNPSLEQIELIIKSGRMQEACFNLPNLVYFTCFMSGDSNKFPNKLSFTGNS